MTNSTTCSRCRASLVARSRVDCAGLSVLTYEDLFDVVLIGLSHGGMVATGVADRARANRSADLPRRVRFDRKKTTCEKSPPALVITPVRRVRELAEWNMAEVRRRLDQRKAA